MGSMQERSIVEATISDLASYLQDGRTTAVDLVTAYLLRIATYDTRNTCLNSVPLLNPDVFEDAAASDRRRAAGQARALEGIPFTVKDSYKVKGMTVGSGSEAFENLVANEDAFTVKALREAGAILIGKTNMCPMAFGGMLRGVYGRAESPYNSKYLAAAFASGSSNGSGVATAASFAAFGMGEETVSSGRSPASNNALVAYTPSRGLISIRGNWPLYPTCDVVVPHTRTMDDLAAILDVLTREDEKSVGDFWRDQPFVKLEQKLARRATSYATIKDRDFLRGKRLAVPAMYIGEPSTGRAVYVSDAVKSLWSTAKAELEQLGATVEVVEDFPVMRLYEDPSSHWPSNYPGEARLPNDWNTIERGTLIAHAWDDFLRVNDDSNFPNLAAADWKKIFPQLPQDDPQMMFSEVKNAVHWSKLASYVETNETCHEPGKSKMFSIPNLERAIKALETMRKRLFEDWMTQNGYDFVVFPAAGDVGYAESDVDIELARHTWRNGVQYSNGNRCLCHLGIPSITVPMGILKDRRMPMGLTILAKAYDDSELLKAGYCFEQSGQRRALPPLTPPIRSDVVADARAQPPTAAPALSVDICEATKGFSNKAVLSLEGHIGITDQSPPGDNLPTLQVFVDGIEMSANGVNLSHAHDTAWHFIGQWTVSRPPAQDKRNSVSVELQGTVL
ncbi:Glutamyl-tRNA(Gln) amidotransferase subunit A [Cyphellophora attinorum]|uniref:Glutamyl-tRNA(Gln) amidotransferase subunit A n=1 Tax=Cyphellophora attinorum TaxID=1664694 RepID=A0A0N1P2H1_9EURO|nr:Glutamyl-tRNA(Gln) amidotransferase subunit A [Phialophora attinorum]KPI45865.1 Glutamyl-tRNA(Gln) amidotransferase subunit A [Phialophora attinorum]